ncbi:hypothetical protein ACE6H2_027153 [Prunus campanulata]
MLKGTGCRRCQACMSQEEVAGHKGAEGIRLASRNLKCRMAQGAEGAKEDYVEVLASRYPKSTPVEDIPIPEEAGRDNGHARCKAPGREIRGLGFGRFLEVGSGSSQRHAALIGCRRHSWMRMRQLDWRLIVESINWKQIAILCGFYYSGLLLRCPGYLDPLLLGLCTCRGRPAAA